MGGNRLQNFITILLVVIVIVLLLFLLKQCQQEQAPSIPAGPVEQFQPAASLVIDTGTVVPGRVRVVLQSELWKAEFEADKPEDISQGLQRLSLTPALENILGCYNVQRVWRTLSQLEQRTNGQVKVISYVDWVKKRQRQQGLRKNARPYEPHELSEAQGSFELKFPDATDLDALVKDLRLVPGVLFAEVIVEPRTLAPYFPSAPGWLDPSDPGYDEALAKGRWGFHNTGSALDPSYLDNFDIDAPQAWEFQRGNPEIVVSVLDNGVDVTHQDLYLNIFLNNGEVPTAIVDAHKAASPDDGLPDTLTFYDLNVPAVKTALNTRGCRLDGNPCADTNSNTYIDSEDVIQWWSGDHNGDGDPDDDANGYVDDLSGWNFAQGDNRPFGAGVGDHGTPVAGLIAAVDNTIGITGVAPRVRILPVRTTFNIMELEYIKAFLPVRVINGSNSHRFSGGTQAEINAIFASLNPEGILYVASLGNANAFYYGSDPSQREPVVSVSNFEADGRRSRSGGSGYGPKTDVAAPGTGLYSLQLAGGTRWFGGTSAASPMTSGLAALIASQNDSLSPEQIRQVLRMTATDPLAVTGDEGENVPGWDLYSGWGLVNAQNAIGAVRDGAVYPEANILSLFKNFARRSNDNEELAIGGSSVPVNAYLGLPAGGIVDWTLRMGGPDWHTDVSGAPIIAGGSGVAYSDGSTPIHTINTDPLDGRQILELQVTSGAGSVSRERAVIDLPRAYISNLWPGQRVSEKIPLEGFAYGPGFSQYHISLAPGWIPSAGDFIIVHTSTTQQAPSIPSDAGDVAPAKQLLAEWDIFSLPVALPASGEATLRVTTEGDRSWHFDIKLLIDITQPPQLAGFPVGEFYSSGSSPTADDINGDGILDLVIAGIQPTPMRGAVDVYNAEGTLLPGWPAELPIGEVITTSVAVGDVDSDGRAEVVLRSFADAATEHIYVINHDATFSETGWPLTIKNPDTQSLERQLDDRPPVLADVNQNGRLDILLVVEKYPPAQGMTSIRAYQYDGTLLRTYATDDAYQIISKPAVGDIDADGEIEVAAIATTDDGLTNTLFVWNSDSSLLWQEEVVNSRVRSSNVALVDIDDDNQLEVIVASSSYNGFLYIYDNDGTFLYRIGNGTSRQPPPAIAQLNPVTSPDLISVTVANRQYRNDVFSSFLYAADVATGDFLPGWGNGVRFGDADAVMQPIVANLRGDAAMEIAFGNTKPSGDMVGFDRNNLSINLAQVDGTLVSDGDQWPVYYSGNLFASPLVTDLDNNGTLEMVVQTSNPYAKTHVYDLATNTGPGAVAWGEYAHNPQRTSNYHGGLKILSPASTTAQNVGPHDDAAAQALLMVRTRFTRSTPSDSENPAHWSATIGDATATVREVVSVQGEHWLLLEPVTQPLAGSYGLRVAFNDGGIRSWDSYRNAVLYETPTQQHSQIAVIDRSGSMGYSDKLPAARVAARFFMESAYSNDEVGVVSYNQRAIDDLDGGVVEAGTNRTLVANAITDLRHGGSTSMGAGIKLGIQLLIPDANTDNPGANMDNRWAMVLLSDGLENTAPFWSRSGASPPVRPDVDILMRTHPEFMINTVAIGPDANQDVLSEIATYTGGTFYPVYLGSSLSLFNRLADAYHFARENIDNTQRLFTHGEQLAPLGTLKRRISLTQGTRRLQIGLNWDREISARAASNTATLPPLQLNVIRPNGTPVSLTDPNVHFTYNRTDTVLTLPAPEPGNWTIQLANISKTHTIETLLVVSADLPVRSNLIVGAQHVDAWGRPYATALGYAIDKSGFVKQTTIQLEVTAPDKSVHTLTLQDDGKHGDGHAGDGILGANIIWEQAGSYLLHAKSVIGGTMNVTSSTGFYNRAGTDRDADGMPDEWEHQHSTACSKGLNPDHDLDADGLDNLTEWHFETDPRNRDSDGDGINDRDEYNNAQPHPLN